ncbi:hypothetical protein [Enterovirga rhinocerotis]|uniref:Uncharacterized protein n=1 Tax=Enterovirga rhinocerotis TaxID=1339210 RepID=A0A4R7BWP0_9HYPH|nr:hypothetical protein [Enterovirga rhinocerotis]TDR90338.1 hypothetical protein EV668_3189 [Enterovirga rhinocerotis]
MTRFPLLPPNTCHGGPLTPQHEPFVGMVGHISRMEGLYPLLSVAQVCVVEAGSQIMAQQRGSAPDRLQMIRWLLFRASALVEREQQLAAASQRQAAE